MFYFIRIVLLFLVLFVGMALVMNHVFVPKKYAQSNTEIAPRTMGMVVSRAMSQPRDTYTGLFLAGTSAQNNRDWVAARENFDKLSEKYATSSSNLLRSMTLSIGAGDFDNAITVAHKIRDQYLGADKVESAQESFDLVRLLLIAEGFKNKNYDVVQSITNNLNDGALSQFAKPIIDLWIAAETTQNQTVKNAKNLNGFQLVYAAMAAEYAGQHETARAFFDKLANGTLTAQMVETLAAFYIRQNDTGSAVDILNKGQTQFPNNEYIRTSLVQLKQGTEFYVASPFVRVHLQGSASGMALAFADFSRLMAAQHATDSALLFARLATYLDNDLPAIYMVIGDILLKQEQKDKALDAYQNVDISDPDFASARIEIAEILNYQNKKTEAIDGLQSIITNHPNLARANLYLTLANLYKANNQFNEAIEAYNISENKALAENDGKAPEWMWFLYYFRGITWDMLDRHGDAEIDLKKALTMKPENAMVLNYLGYSYADKGQNLQAAYDMIARAIEQKPDDAYIVDSMGWVLYRMGRYEEAVESLEKAASLRPYNSVINDHLGDAYWKVGRQLEARYMWQRAVDYIPDNTITNLDADDDEQAEVAKGAAEKLKNGLVD